MKRNKLAKEKYKMYHYTGKCNGAKSSAQGNKTFKEKPNAKWNKGSGDHRATPYPTVSNV